LLGSATCSAASLNIPSRGSKNCCRIVGLRHPGNSTSIYSNINPPFTHLLEGFMGRLHSIAQGLPVGNQLRQSGGTVFRGLRCQDAPPSGDLQRPGCRDGSLRERNPRYRNEQSELFFPSGDGVVAARLGGASTPRTPTLRGDQQRPDSLGIGFSCLKSKKAEKRCEVCKTKKNRALVTSYKRRRMLGLSNGFETTIRSFSVVG
jgi:hypothetical protein